MGGALLSMFSKKGKEYILRMLLKHKMDIKRNIEDKELKDDKTYLFSFTY